MDLQNVRSTKALQCPRCDSFDTKFCYYNNYNYSQPRHFCKSCRRYWTIGGVLRNVPVGGGSRKSKNPKSKPPIARDSPNSEVLSPSRLFTENTATGARSAVDSSTITNCSSERSSIPFALGCIGGTTPLKLNQVGDCYGWIENGREVRTAEVGRPEKRTRGEGFGSLDLSGSGESEGMVGISSAVDGGSWFKFCGLAAPFNN